MIGRVFTYADISHTILTSLFCKREIQSESPRRRDQVEFVVAIQACGLLRCG
jgi:hypothetical protein